MHKPKHMSESQIRKFLRPPFLKPRPKIKYGTKTILNKKEGEK